MRRRITGCTCRWLVVSASLIIGTSFIWITGPSCEATLNHLVHVLTARPSWQCSTPPTPPTVEHLAPLSCSINTQPASIHVRPIPSWSNPPPRKAPPRAPAGRAVLRSGHRRAGIQDSGGRDAHLPSSYNRGPESSESRASAGPPPRRRPRSWPRSRLPAGAHPALPHRGGTASACHWVGSSVHVGRAVRPGGKPLCHC